jgi:hypothetical protein
MLTRSTRWIRRTRERRNTLRETYKTLVREWGVRFIKMDFMDTTAIEGYYYRPNTTALEAQRIGLQLIRDTVGDDVILDKDGSPMLNPVGISGHRPRLRRHRTQFSKVEDRSSGHRRALLHERQLLHH